jgi:uncharacterized protein (DUF1015 family)
MVEPKYEEKIAGRIRADVQIDDKVTIEVKSHGLFGKKDLRERFEKIARAKPEMKHIYVAFRERNDLVEKTREILEPLGVSVFFLSIYTSGKNENATYSANDLESLIETTKGAVSR